MSTNNTGETSGPWSLVRANVFPDLPSFPFVHRENSYELPEGIRNLREQGPVHRIQLFDGTPAWIVTRHKEVCEALGSPKLSNVRKSEGGTSF